jgi:hypothetical protein
MKPRAFGDAHAEGIIPTIVGTGDTDLFNTNIA